MHRLCLKISYCLYLSNTIIPTLYIGGETIGANLEKSKMFPPF